WRDSTAARLGCRGKRIGRGQQQIAGPVPIELVARKPQESPRRVGHDNRTPAYLIEDDEVPPAFRSQYVGDCGQRRQKQGFILALHCLRRETELLGRLYEPEEVCPDSVRTSQIAQPLHRQRPAIVAGECGKCGSAAVALVVLPDRGVTS